MSQPVGRRSLSHHVAFSLFLAILWCGVPVGFAAEPGAPSPSSQDQSSQPEEAGDVQERGLTNLRPGPATPGANLLPPATQPGGTLPPNLCQPVTRELTQCKCFNQSDCQSLTAICPGACPAGSQSCECVPMFRGTPSPLPRKLCHYQVPITITQCSCHNDADCQVLANICPASCPVGSHSCECTPLQRR